MLVILVQVAVVPGPEAEPELVVAVVQTMGLVSVVVANRSVLAALAAGG